SDLLAPGRAAINILDRAPCCAPDARAERGIVAQTPDELQRLLARVEEKAVDAMDDVVGVAAAPAADHRQPAGHGLEHHAAVGFQPLVAGSVVEAIELA